MAFMFILPLIMWHVDTCGYNHDCNCEAKEITVCNCKCHEAKDIQETACETFKCK